MAAQGLQAFLAGAQAAIAGAIAAVAAMVAIAAAVRVFLNIFRVSILKYASKPWGHRAVARDEAQSGRSADHCQITAVDIFVCSIKHLSRYGVGPLGHQKLVDMMDDAIRPHGAAGGQSAPPGVTPNAADAVALRCRDFPFEIVANHPSLFRR